MSWVTIIWSMIASACLTLAAVYLLVWCKQRTAWASLLFSLTAMATAAMAFCELEMMRAETPGQFGTALRWIHVAAFVVIVSLIGFVLFYMRAGRPWLAWTVCTLRTFSLLLNFLTGQNLNYREVTGLRHVPFLGESVSVGEGVSNPWMLVGQLSLLLFVVFVADATITVWRRGDRRQVLVLGGSIVFFVLATTVQSVLALWQIVHAPITPSLFYMSIVAAMAFEMSRVALRSEQLSDDLRESEERMTLAAEAAGIGVWMWNIARNQIWGSERWLRLFGFEPGAAVSFEMLVQRVHPDDRERVEREVRRALEDRSDYMADYRVVLPDGTQRWIAARGRMYPGTHEKPARMLSATIDITERKRTEEALQNSEEKFRQFFKNTPDYCYIISTEGNILHVNEAALKTLGYKREELVGQPLARIYAPESVARMEDLLNRWKESGQIRDEEMVIVTRKGERRVVILNVGAVKDKDGMILHSTSVQTDITGRKQAELEIVQQRNELAHVGRVSTISQLASTLAHELNQPLGAILRNAEAAELFLQSDPPDLEEVRAILADIRKDDQRAGEVIDRMRALLKRRGLEHTTLDIVELVEDVVPLVHPDAVSRRVRLDIEVPRNLPPVRGDRVHLQQVLLNLILNGMDAMGEVPAEARRLTVRARQADAGTIEVAIADAGHGVPAEKFARLFEPFFTTKPNGMGLGLPISSTIIEAHGGRIWAENSSAGATFYFTVPVTTERVAS